MDEKGSAIQSPSFLREGLSEDVHDQIKVYGNLNKRPNNFHIAKRYVSLRYRFDVIPCEARKYLGLILNDRAKPVA